MVEGVYNVARGEETSLLGLAEALLRVMGSDLPVEHGPERGVNGVVRRLADTSAAERDLGFVAQTSLEEGLRRARGVVAPAARGDRRRAARAGGGPMSLDASLTRINVMQPWLGEEEVAAVAEVLRSGWVAQGPQGRRLRGRLRGSPSRRRTRWR